MDIDVFNGDADGICALIQLRLAEPTDSVLITGVKRDIQLLDKVDARQGDKITVLDISMLKNQQGLKSALNSGAEVFYVDHHQSGDIPQHSKLNAIIDTAPTTCTSLLVSEYLQHRYLPWAVTAAFGDNLNSVAVEAAKPLRLSEEQLQQLQTLGVCINYNSYGASLDDLLFKPEQLYKTLSGYQSPFEFIKQQNDFFQQLVDGYQTDMNLAGEIAPEYSNEAVAVYILPDEKWARRVSGVFSNDLANEYPARAHAVLSHHKQGGYVVSVRAPLQNKTGADELCASFPGGGGRKAAAGINQLTQDMLADFIAAFDQKYSL